jgi:hypothetical protein
LSARQAYRPPTDEERAAAVRGLAAVLADGVAASPDLAELGFSVEDGVDGTTGRPYTLAVNEPGTERAWGLYAVDRSAPPSLVVEVPHPNSDLLTEIAGLDYFHLVPGAVLLVAGAHRRARERQADVAHRTDSLFHAVAAELGARGLPQVQLHGFGDLSMPGADVVLSSGAARAGAPARRAAEELSAAGFAVCHAWQDPCKGLEGRTNAQGIAAARGGTMFLHVEMSRTLREDPARRAAATAALAAARLDAP